MPGEDDGSGTLTLGGGRFTGLLGMGAPSPTSIGAVALGVIPGAVALCSAAKRFAPLAMFVRYVHAARNGDLFREKTKL